MSPNGTRAHNLSERIRLYEGVRGLIGCVLILMHNYEPVPVRLGTSSHHGVGQRANSNRENQ